CRMHRDSSADYSVESSHGSKFHRELELGAVAGKIGEIEGQGSLVGDLAASDLHVPSRGHKCFSGELQVERRPQIERVAGETVEPYPLVMAQIPELGAD